MSARKPKIVNPPARIFLQVGIDDESTDVPWHEISVEDVTWHDERIDESDIEYRLVRRSARETPGEPK